MPHKSTIVYSLYRAKNMLYSLISFKIKYVFYRKTQEIKAIKNLLNFIGDFNQFCYYSL